jgi:hypothetical protein
MSSITVLRTADICAPKRAAPSKLSLIDDINERNQLGVVFIYRKPLPVAVLEEALHDTLEYFPILAGKIKQLEVENGGKGLRFVVAKSTERLPDDAALESRNLPCM